MAVSTAGAQLLLLLIAALCAPIFAANLPRQSSVGYNTPDVIAGRTLTLLNKKALENSLARLESSKNPTCNKNNVRIRREWRTLPIQDRKDFISAVKCIRTSPSLYPPGTVPGSHSLYDDFVAVHLNQTVFIHLTATFLTWHRYFIWEYEAKLNACGYKGSLPYWEWGLDTHNVSASPIFDGSDLSLGGDGAHKAHPGLMLSIVGTPNFITLPSGTGGGCVPPTTGPLGTLSMSLGPIALPSYGSPVSTGAAIDGSPFSAWFADNPRCLKRDLNAAVAARYSSFFNSTSLVLGTKDIEHFQALMQGDPRYVPGELGVHGGGHYTIGGDPGGDAFISPGDPAFWLHHGQVDRLYWIWQSMDFGARQNVFGTGTLLNMPPSPNVTVNDFINLAPLTATQVRIKSIMDTVGGTPLCYVYI